MKNRKKSRQTNAVVSRGKRKGKMILLIIAFIAVVGFVYSMGDQNVRSEAETYEANVTISTDEDISKVSSGAVQKENGTYIGSLSNGQLSGIGTFKFDTGETYEGEWNYSQMNGRGKLTYPGYGTYTGEFIDGMRDGKGTFKFENGDELNGEWSNDQPDEGKYTFKSGAYFEGSFQDEIFSNGDFHYKNISKKIKRLYLQIDGDSFTEYIEYIGTNGYKYSGELGEGEATIVYKNKDTYSGDVYNWKKQGSGTYKWKRKGKTVAYYTGKWKNGKMAGSGVYHYKKSKYPYLKGKFNNNKPTGTLKYYKKKGVSYKTKWRNGRCIRVW